jgi:DDE superfamily endonuclease
MYKQFFDNQRVIMWDMTNITITQPSNAETARLTYSQYYNSNCGKGGIFLQSSSWIGTHDLWMGAVSDSDYLTRSGILQNQCDFVEDDLFCDVPFTNITDKGFRVTADCFRYGRQRLLQPPFMKSNRRFSSQQTFKAAAIVLYVQPMSER